MYYDVLLYYRYFLFTLTLIAFSYLRNVEEAALGNLHQSSQSLAGPHRLDSVSLTQ